MERIRKDFSTMTWVMIVLAIAINIVLGQLNLTVFHLPIYLDSVGTILVGVLAGPWAGALTGILANVVWTVSGAYVPAIAFALVAGVIGLMSGFFGNLGWMRTSSSNWWKVIVAGLVTGLLAALFSAPIAAYLFGGVTASSTDALVVMFSQLGAGVLGSNVLQGAVSDPFDKAISYVLVWLILFALPKRLIALFPRSTNVIEQLPVVAAPAPAMRTMPESSSTSAVASAKSEQTASTVKTTAAKKPAASKKPAAAKTAKKPSAKKPPAKRPAPTRRGR